MNMLHQNILNIVKGPKVKHSKWQQREVVKSLESNRLGLDPRP